MRHFGIAAVVSVAVLFSTLPVAAARELFVNNQTGDDIKDGSAPTSQGRTAGPFRTIGRALQRARRGDAIIIANTGEPYRECLSIQGGNHTGTEYLPFTIIGNGATLDGALPVDVPMWEHVAGDVFRFRPRHFTYALLHVDGQPAPRVKVAAGTSQVPELKEGESCQVDGYLYYRVKETSDVAAYDFTYTAMQAGITLYAVRNVLIRDLVVQGFRIDGINAHDSVFNAKLIGVISRGNGRSGISVGGASRVAIEESLVGSNGRAQLRTEGYSHTRVIRSNLVNDDPTAPGLVRDGGKVTVEQ